MAGYSLTRGRHKMGGNDELFKTTARAMLGRMPWPDGGLTQRAGFSSPLPACGEARRGPAEERGEGDKKPSVFAHDGPGGLG